MNARKATTWLGGHLAAAAVVGITAVVLGIIMLISYAHEVELASRNGQVAWVAELIPFAVDGMLVVASIALYWAGQHGIRRPVPPFSLRRLGWWRRSARTLCPVGVRGGLGLRLRGRLGWRRSWLGGLRSG